MPKYHTKHKISFRPGGNMGDIGSLFYALKLLKPFMSSLSLLVSSSIRSGYGPSSGRVPYPGPAVQGIGHAIELGTVNLDLNNRPDAFLGVEFQKFG
jgi:hypothetical protein